MSQFPVDGYRIIAGILTVLLFFVAARPYFSAKGRVMLCAITAGFGNSLLGGALLGTPLSGLPLRFAIAFVGVGAGVALLEYLLPEGKPYRWLGGRSRA